MPACSNRCISWPYRSARWIVQPYFFDTARLESSSAPSTNLCRSSWLEASTKGVNDTYGHIAGDHVLITVASRCSRARADVDVAARYGGRKFIFLLQKPAISPRLAGACASIRAGDRHRLNLRIAICQLGGRPARAGRHLLRSRMPGPALNQAMYRKRITAAVSCDWSPDHREIKHVKAPLSHQKFVEDTLHN